MGKAASAGPRRSSAAPSCAAASPGTARTITIAASFSGASAGVAPFAITAGTDEVQADVVAGIEMISSEDSALRIFYDGHFGDRIAIHAAGLKASVKF